MRSHGARENTKNPAQTGRSSEHRLKTRSRNLRAAHTARAQLVPTTDTRTPWKVSPALWTVFFVFAPRCWPRAVRGESRLNRAPFVFFFVIVMFDLESARAWLLRRLQLSGVRPWGVLGACGVPDGRHATGRDGAGRTHVQARTDAAARSAAHSIVALLGSDGCEGLVWRLYCF